MILLEVIEKTQILLENAETSYDKKLFAESERSLVKLRELLNSHPELEAGGSCQERSSST